VELLGDWKRRDGWWVQADSFLDGKGNLVLRTKKDGERFTSGAVRTRGRFEHFKATHSVVDVDGARVLFEDGWALVRDFSDEVPGYLHNAAMAHALEELDLKSGQEHLSENLFRCYQTLTERGWVGKEELPLVEAWIQDAEIR